MYRLLLFIMLLVAFETSFAQQNSIADTNAIKQLIDSSNKYEGDDPTQQLKLLEKAKTIAQITGTVWLARCLKEEGLYYYNASMYDRSITASAAAAQLYLKAGDVINYTKCLNNLGTAYMYSGSYNSALQTLFLALEQAKLLNDLSMQASILNNISLVYQTVEDMKNALTFSKESLHFKLQLKDSARLPGSYANVANFYADMESWDSALYNYRQAKSLYAYFDDSVGMSSIMLGIGNVFLGQKKYDSAYFYLAKSVDNFTSEVSVVYRANTWVALLRVCTEMGRINEAESIKPKVEELAVQIADPEFQRLYHRAMYQYWLAKGNVQQGFKSLQEYVRYRDTFDLNSKNIEFQKLALQYELGKKVVADSVQAAQKVVLAQNETTQTRKTLLTVVLIALLLAAVAVIFYNRSKLLSRKNIIAQQNILLAAQQQKTNQLRILQAQMNPHFIFNCFSSIDAWILQNKPLEASALVENFSMLCRRILEQTSLPHISLSEELKTIRLYLEIEQMRSHHSFDFAIDIEPSLLNICTPPMLLQPFVENAVIHGIKPLTQHRGLIGVSVKETSDGYVCIVIADNGVGMVAGAQHNNEDKFKHKSVSMQLTLERLAALHTDMAKQDYFAIESSLPRVYGTSVQIKLPKTQTIC